MVTKLKDGRILPWKNNRLLSLEIRRRRRRRKRKKNKKLGKMSTFLGFFIYMFSGPLFKSVNGLIKEKVIN